MRYFIIFFVMQTQNGIPAFGHCTLSQERYPNAQDIQRQVKGEMGTQFSIPTITGINEVTEEDFIEWRRE